MPIVRRAGADNAGGVGVARAVDDPRYGGLRYPKILGDGVAPMSHSDARNDRERVIGLNAAGAQDVALRVYPCLRLLLLAPRVLGGFDVLFC